MTAREEYEAWRGATEQYSYYEGLVIIDAALAEADERIKELESTQQLCIVYNDQMYFEDEVVEKLAQAEATIERLTEQLRLCNLERRWEEHDR